MGIEFRDDAGQPWRRSARASEHGRKLVGNLGEEHGEDSSKVPGDDFEVRPLGVLRGNGDASVGADVDVVAQRAKRQSLWSQRPETEQPEELKPGHRQHDVIDFDGTAPAVDQQCSWLRQPPSSHAPGGCQLAVGLDRRYGSFGENGLDFI